jgi:uncharacterized protein (TIGR03089 family)
LPGYVGVILRRTGERGVSPYPEGVPVTTIADLTSLLTREPGRPRITWYGADGERVELSGAVLDNWVSKTTNLLVDELDAEPGVVVMLDLPTHWRTVVWALSVWRAGACVVLPGADTASADVVVTDDPARHPDARALVAVPLPALARSFAGPLPAGAVDAGAAVMTYGDAIGWAPAVDPSARALVAPGLVLPHRELLDALAARPGTPREREALVATSPVTVDDLAGVVSVLVREGSVVLLEARLADLLRHDRPRLDRLLTGEQVTAHPFG